MKFSIIVPTFNNLEYLKLCIDSIKKNSKYNHEIIVHNNGERNLPIHIYKKIKYYLLILAIILV